MPKGLPKTTQSLCPDCGQLIEARIFEDNGKVVMEKRCASHGEFRDIVYSDAKLYLKMEKWTCGDNRGLKNPTSPLAGMHFMDSYNYDVEGVKRCVIHYAAPNGLIYPFCAYNSGPVYCEKIEKQFSVPAETEKELRKLTVKARQPELVG